MADISEFKSRIQLTVSIDEIIELSTRVAHSLHRPNSTSLLCMVVKSFYFPKKAQNQLKSIGCDYTYGLMENNLRNLPEVPPPTYDEVMNHIIDQGYEDAKRLLRNTFGKNTKVAYYHYDNPARLTNWEAEVPFLEEVFNEKKQVKRASNRSTTQSNTYSKQTRNHAEVSSASYTQQKTDGYSFLTKVIVLAIVSSPVVFVGIETLESSIIFALLISLAYFMKSKKVFIIYVVSLVTIPLVFLAYTTYVNFTKNQKQHAAQTQTQTNYKKVTSNYKHTKPKQQAAKRYSLTISTNVYNPRIKILNIKQKYYPGIKLRPGVYKIQITKTGYYSQTFIVQMRNSDRRIRKYLQKKPSKTYANTKKNTNIKKTTYVRKPSKQKTQPKVHVPDNAKLDKNGKTWSCNPGYMKIRENCKRVI